MATVKSSSKALWVHHAQMLAENFMFLGLPLAAVVWAEVWLAQAVGWWASAAAGLVLVTIGWLGVGAIRRLRPKKPNVPDPPTDIAFRRGAFYLVRHTMVTLTGVFIVVLTVSLFTRDILAGLWWLVATFVLALWGMWNRWVNYAYRLFEYGPERPFSVRELKQWWAFLAGAHGGSSDLYSLKSEEGLFTPRPWPLEILLGTESMLIRDGKGGYTVLKDVPLMGHVKAIFGYQYGAEVRNARSTAELVEQLKGEGSQPAAPKPFYQVVRNPEVGPPDHIEEEGVEYFRPPF